SQHDPVDDDCHKAYPESAIMCRRRHWRVSCDRRSRDRRRQACSESGSAFLAKGGLRRILSAASRTKYDILTHSHWKKALAERKSSNGNRNQLRDARTTIYCCSTFVLTLQGSTAKMSAGQ